MNICDSHVNERCGLDCTKGGRISDRQLFHERFMRYVQRGRDIWDTFYARPPREGEAPDSPQFMRALMHDLFVTRYPSDVAASEACESLNQHWRENV